MRVTLGSMVGKTVFLSCSHFVVRVIGFALRIGLSRELGPQAMGLAELAQSAQMLLITPVVSGLPAAVSRMCAKAEPARQRRILRVGMALALGAGLPLTLAAFCLREQLALWLGDARTLPALLVYLPCIPILGASCALNGYYYGRGKPVPPALSELLEQLVRLLLCVRLVYALRGWPLMLRAAIPSAAALLGELAGLLLMLLLALRAVLGRGEGSRRAIAGEMLSLALPLTGMRVVSSLMRTVNATLIPARLRLSGLSSAQALSQLGMLQGMLMPVLMMPSFITGSLTMVVSPEITRRQAQGLPLARPVRRVLAATLLVGLAAMTAVYAAAPVVSGALYREAALLPFLRVCCALIPVMSLCQASGGMMNALGLQTASLRISLTANLLSVLTVYALAAQSGVRLWGAVAAIALSHLATLLLSWRCIRRELRKSA